jgi:UDP-N-acetylmuramyl tripeptide synthase
VRRIVGTLLGKTVAGAVRLRGKSSGQAMPGLVVEKFVPGYLRAMLRQLPDGVVIITGTNGKTTTTKMVVELLRAAGKRVLTNPTGSNLTRGIISSVSQQARTTGRLPFDLAVFELDEAYARLFTDVMRPRYVLGLNASRDQLDRFGEVDTVARLIGDTMLAATDAIIVNADDKRLSAIAARANPAVTVSYFGVAPQLLQFFPRDDELVAVAQAPVITDKTRSARKAAATVPRAVELVDFKNNNATYRFDTEQYTASLQVTGQHNFQNAAGALALVRAILPDANPTQLIEKLATIKPAFGRGQTYRLANGSKLQLNLVKNPASFRQGLASYVRPNTAVMVAINDNIADSRDMSWLWDVDFSSLHGQTIALTTGSRAVDMALRFSYDDIPVRTVESDLAAALRQFCELPGDKVIFASYTAMLRLHTLLDERTAASNKMAQKAGK